jgi:glycine cleavage system transcriptional repressor
MKSWFVLSAMGRDRPGLVAELSQLIFDCDANLEDSRMTILGSDFAVILLGSHAELEAAEQLAVGAKRLERDHGLTILIRPLEAGPRSEPPRENARVRRVRAAGQDRAGIVAGVCRTLAEQGVNIAELTSRTLPGHGGEPHYEMDIIAELPERADEDALRAALDAEADRLVIDVSLETP